MRKTSWPIQYMASNGNMIGWLIYTLRMILLCSAIHTTVYKTRQHSCRPKQHDWACEKTKAMSVALEQSPSVTIGQQSIEYMDNFPHLGSYISRGSRSSTREPGWLICLSATPPNMDQQYRQHDHQVTSVQIHYDSGSNLCSWCTWKGTTRISHILDVFHRRCLLTILGISWRDHITNDELMSRAWMGTYRILPE